MEAVRSVSENIATAINWLRDPFRISLVWAIATSFLLGALYAAERACNPLIVSTVHVISEWQTLIAGGAALLAAWIATVPVRRQLSEMRKQSAAVSIPVYQDMIERTAAEKELTGQIARALVVISNTLYKCLTENRATTIEEYRSITDNATELEDLGRQWEAASVLDAMTDAEHASSRAAWEDCQKACDELRLFAVDRIMVADEWAQGYDITDDPARIIAAYRSAHSAARHAFRAVLKYRASVVIDRGFALSRQLAAARADAIGARH